MDLEFVGHSPALHINRLGFALLLRKDGRHGQSPELHLRFDTEETLATGDEGSCEGQAHITGFHLAEYLIVLTGVGYARFILKIEHCLGVVCDPQLHLVADLAGDAHLDLVIEIEGGIFPHLLGQ